MFSTFYFKRARLGGLLLISIKVKGNFDKTTDFLKRNQKIKVPNLEKLAKEGVEALAAMTPVDTGLTQASWGYEISQKDGNISITWTNSNLTKNGIPIVILLHYGHATKDGGYVKGSEFIDEALQPVFKRIADEVWKEVNK